MVIPVNDPMHKLDAGASTATLAHVQLPVRLAFGSLVVFSIGIMTGNAVAQRSVRSSPFPDVEAGTEAAEAIGRFALLNILQGYGDGFFGPNDALTRAQGAMLFARMEDRLIAPLREEVQELRRTLNLGTCGDGKRQATEECDDGNHIDEDGCSASCLTESLHSGCAGGRRFGESFQAPDGCNTCICSRDGVACTKMLCAKPELEEQVEEELPVEEPVEPDTEVPSPPMSMGEPQCGNGFCELYENSLPPNRRFHCPQDCTGEEPQRQCEVKKKELLRLNAGDTECSATADCTLIRQSCPHVTCGLAVNKSSYPKFSLAIDDMLDTCRREGAKVECVLCAYAVAVCERGICVVKRESE